MRAIDLNSQHPSIEEIDFFDVCPEEAYDVLVSSMVLNYVPEPAKRGEMLMRMILQLSQQGGCLCLILPVRCVRSKLVGEDCFLRLLVALGLEEALPVNITPKLIFYVMRRACCSITASAPGKPHQDWRVSADRLLSGLPDDLRDKFSLARTLETDPSNKQFSLALPESFSSL